MQLRNFNKLKSRITLFKKEDSGWMPGEEEYVEYYSCAAHIDNVWLKDLEIAKTNNTLNDVTVTIREPGPDTLIDNGMYFEIEGRRNKERTFNIKSTQPDYQDNRFMVIVGEAVT